MAGGWRLILQREFARGLLYENFIGTSGVVLRKNVLDRIGTFDESLSYSEDRDLWFRLAHDCDALYHDRIGHSYRIAAGSLSLRPGSHQARSRIETLQREKDRWTSAPERRQIDRLIAENLAAVAYDYRRTGQRLASVRTFLQALATYPEGRWLRGAVGSLLLKAGSKVTGGLSGEDFGPQGSCTGVTAGAKVAASSRRSAAAASGVYRAAPSGLRWKPSENAE